MGNIPNKQKTGITEVDKAVLSLKAQRRRLEDHRKQVLNQIDREQAIARQLVASGHRDRALLALKKRRIQETSLEKLDAWLINVESTLAQVQTSLDQTRLVSALQKGNEALKQMQKAVSLEDVEKLIEDSAEAREYQEQLQTMLKGAVTEEDERMIGEEIEALEAEAAQISMEEFPAVPTGQIVAKKAGVERLQDVKEKSAENSGGTMIPA